MISFILGPNVNMHTNFDILEEVVFFKCSRKMIEKRVFNKFLNID